MVKMRQIASIFSKNSGGDTPDPLNTVIHDWGSEICRDAEFEVTPLG